MYMLMTSNSLAGGQLPCYFLVLNESCRSLCIIQSKAEHITRDTFSAPSDVVWWCLPPLTYFPFPSCLVLLHLHHATTQHGLCPYFWLTPGQAAIPLTTTPCWLPAPPHNHHLLNCLAQDLRPTPSIIQDKWPSPLLFPSDPHTSLQPVTYTFSM